jgi:hypothetical protein
VLSGEAMRQVEKADAEAGHSPLADINFLDLCKLGLAITWPLALILLAAVVFLALQLGRH